MINSVSIEDPNNEEVHKTNESEEKESSESSEFDNNAKFHDYEQLYPPIQSLTEQDNNNNSNSQIKKKILMNSSQLSSPTKKKLYFYNMSDEFLRLLTKNPCPIDKNQIINIISNFIFSSKLINKLENEYQSEKKMDSLNLCVLCAEHFSYMDLSKGGILFKIGEIGDRFYFILKGKISILKLKQLTNVKMTLFRYINYCMFLLKKKEPYILDEVIKANSNFVNFPSVEDVKKIYKILFMKILRHKLISKRISNIETIKNLFLNYDQNFDDYNIKEEEIPSNNFIHYFLKRCKPSKEDLKYFEPYEHIQNDKKEYKIICYSYEPFLYLYPGSFFGETSLDLDFKKRNATIRAEENTVLGWLKSTDYVNMIAPKRRMEKLKEIYSVYNNFFFKQISIHLFEKNYFHLFALNKYNRNTILFTTDMNPKSLIFMKEGNISLEIMSSIINIPKLIKYIFDNIYNNILFNDLPTSAQKKILNSDVIDKISNYTSEGILKNIRKYSQNFIKEVSKVRKYKIAELSGNEIIGLEEIFLGIPYLMTGKVINKKSKCYEITIDHLDKILSNEKDIVRPYINSSINKIFSLIERLHNLKQNYISLFINKYEKDIIPPLEKRTITDENKENKKLFTKNIKYEQLIKMNHLCNNKNLNNSNKSSFENKNYNYMNLRKMSNTEKTKHPIKMNLRSFTKNNRTEYFTENNKIKPLELVTKKTDYQNFLYTPSKNNIITLSNENRFLNSESRNDEPILIGNRDFSLKKLEKKFNELNLCFNRTKTNENNFINVIQSNRYLDSKSNENQFNILKEYNKNLELYSESQISEINLKKNKIRTENIIKNKQQINNYRLSYVPLNNLYENYKNNINNQSRNEKLLFTNKYISPLTSFSQSQSNIAWNTQNKTCLSFYMNTTKTTTMNDNNENEINEIPKKNYKKRNKTTINKLFNGKKKDKKYLPNVIKKFYKNIKLKGCLYSIPKIECNTFMMRKFHKKYDSAEKNKK